MEISRHHQITVPENLDGVRLDRALAALFADYSRTNIKAWIENAQVTVNGTTRRPRDPVAGGDRVEITATFTPIPGLHPEPIDYGVLYADRALVVIDKPAGLVVHPGAGNREHTLVNGLLHRFPELAELPRAGLIHRLDKDTSGVLVVARTARAYQELVRQMADRRIRRAYEGVVTGVMIAGGTIDAAIGRDRRDRTKMAVAARGRPAVTHYHVLRRFRAHTHIAAELETGRTHQIRVHLAYAGFPIVGDRRYGARRRLPRAPSAALVAGLEAFTRHALHARHLQFAHPDSGREVAFEAPLASDLRALLAALAADSGA